MVICNSYDYEYDYYKPTINILLLWQKRQLQTSIMFHIKSKLRTKIEQGECSLFHTHTHVCVNKEHSPCSILSLVFLTLYFISLKFTVQVQSIIWDHLPWSSYIGEYASWGLVQLRIHKLSLLPKVNEYPLKQWLHAQPNPIEIF